MYLATCTRQDLSYAISQLSKHLMHPTCQHWSVLKHLIRNIKGTIDLKLRYDGTNPTMVGYTDSDFAGDVNTRKSTSGYVFSISGGAVIWGSKQQREVAQSTSEAEYLAANLAGKEAIWLYHILDALWMKPGVPLILCDNQSCLRLIKDRTACRRSKHIEVGYHCIRDLVERGRIRFMPCSSNDNLADLFTKGLPAPQFGKLRHRCGVKA